jgi:acyl-CoA thioester hydrolase
MQYFYKFFIPLQVRYAETDAQGHVFFGNYLTYFDVALTEYLKAIGYSYDVMLAEGIDFYYVEALCEYKDRAFFDEILHVHATISRIGNTSLTFEFAIVEASKLRLTTTGRVAAVAVDRGSKKPVRVPDGLRRAVEDFENR